MSDIEIEIDGKKLTAQPNVMLIQVADEAGIYIPRFCYHKHLSIAANCRMCLVEVEKSPKPLPACATPVMPGMKVFTRSPKAIAAQKAVMEFLLINHPLDCPICDQGGECELQDISMGYGSAESYYVEGKRSIKDQDLGPLIATDMTRCIQCTRCVRFGTEVAGFRELGATGRGEHMEIGTYVQHAMQSEVSGNIIDLCPVGALTSKPFRFTARAWELQQFPSIAAHDCIGSHINVHTRSGKVMRVVPREDIHINQTWISDRDRYSYEGLYHLDRLENPRIRVDGVWQDVDWQTALEAAVEGLKNVLHIQGPDQLAALASPNSTLEEFYLLQKLVRSLGSPHIDHRLREVDFSDQMVMPGYPGLNMSLDELENCDVILLVGSDIQREQPIASLRVRKAALKGAAVIAVNMKDYDFHFDLKAKKVFAPHDFVYAVQTILQALVSNNTVHHTDQAIARFLQQGKKVAVILGAMALNHPHAAQIRVLANTIAVKTGGVLGLLTEGANSAGAWLAGAIPHRQAGGQIVKAVGLDAQEVWLQPRKSYVLFNVEPDLDCANPFAAIRALEQTEFVVSLSVFKNPLLEQYANVMLPIGPFSETSGTFVNAMGHWQSFKGVAEAWEESRPGWKVLRVLGNLFDCEGFDYESSEKVREEVKNLCDIHALNSSSATWEDAIFSITQSEENIFSRIGEIPLYAGDSLVRRAKALQVAQTLIEKNGSAVHIHPHAAEQLQIKEFETVILKQKEGRVRLPVVFDKRLPEKGVSVSGGIQATSGLSSLLGPIEIHKA